MAMEDYLRKIVQISLGSSPEDMLKTSLGICVEILNADTGSILGEEGPYLRFLFSDAAQLIGMQVPFNSVAGHTVTANKVIYTYAPKDKRHFDGVDKHTRQTTNYLLSVPIPSIHQGSRNVQAKNAGALQALFNENVFPDLDPKDGPIEFSLDDFKSGDLCEGRFREIFWILPMIAFGMEVMKLRQTSYQAIHELKNKMISGLSWLDYLRDDIQENAPELLKNEAIEEDIDLSRGSISEGAELAKNYLQFTKLYSPEFAPVNINDVLKETAGSARAVAREMGAEGFTTDERFDANIQSRELDGGKLKMAFFNLCKNAVEALAEHKIVDPKITITSEALEDGRVNIAIQDNGPGMPQEIADSLFIPFKTKKEGGTGLGLTITKKIIDLHGGTILCETSSDGTRFSITL